MSYLKSFDEGFYTGLQRLYEDLKSRIVNVTEIGRVPEELRLEHEGFMELDSFTSVQDHSAIVQVLLDHNQAREKRPDHFHNFKAGAMNALIRVSSMISNGQVILNVDCDMYSNSSHSIKDALCFFMDEEKGHEIAFVQHPQRFENVMKNEVYGGSLRVFREVFYWWWLTYHCTRLFLFVKIKGRFRAWSLLYRSLSLCVHLSMFSKVVVVVVMLLTANIGVFGIRFTINRRECLSHKAEYGATIRFSFVVINVEDYEGWQLNAYNTDLVVKGPDGEQIQDFRDKTSDKSEFVAYKEGLYQFCFSNQSPFQETVDFDVHSSYFYKDVDHLKDDHVNPIMEQISKLEDVLAKVQFEQHWLEAEGYQHAIINERMSKRAMHKALVESAALISASILQVYLLQRLFARKLGISS